jgi:uncharacterized UPF0160 family protein
MDPRELLSTITTIAVHDGTFHADDVFACAIIRILRPDIEIIRTRDEERLAAAGFRIDVGGKHQLSTGDFDHHMTGGCGARKSGFPYAACGLIWKHFGMLIVKNEKIFDKVDRLLIQTIDAVDSGYSFGEDKLPYQHYTISDSIDSFNPSWNDPDQDSDAAFMKALDFAQTVLSNEIRHSAGFEAARGKVYECVRASKDPRYIVLDCYCPWQEIVVLETQAQFVLFPTTNGDWRIRAVPDKIGSFFNRRSLPKHWGGLTREELVAVTGIQDALFCHQALFIAGAKSKEGTLKMLELALR